MLSIMKSIKQRDLRSDREKAGKILRGKTFSASQNSDFGLTNCLLMCWKWVSFPLWSIKLSMNKGMMDWLWRMNDALVHEHGHSRTTP